MNNTGFISLVVLSAVVLCACGQGDSPVGEESQGLADRAAQEGCAPMTRAPTEPQQPAGWEEFVRNKQVQPVGEVMEYDAANGDKVRAHDFMLVSTDLSTAAAIGTITCTLSGCEGTNCTRGGCQPRFPDNAQPYCTAATCSNPTVCGAASCAQSITQGF